MMKSAKFCYQTYIIERYLDVFGHVNNAVYMQLYEQARWDIIHSFGFGLDYVLKNQRGPVLLESHIKFKKELHNRDDILIETHFEYEGGKIFNIFQKMLNPRQEIASEAHFLAGYMDLELRKLIVPDSEWLRCFNFT